jgi:hypothetical protein
MMLYLGIAIGVIVTAAVFIGGPVAYWGVVRRRSWMKYLMKFCAAFKRGITRLCAFNQYSSG